jgi:hypothetical protein
VKEWRNTCGQAYSLTVLTPIREGGERPLARYLNALQSGPRSPLAGVPATHFARWVVIGDVVYEGPGQRPDHLGRARLLFTSNLDGSPDAYLEGLCSALGATADAIWGHCDGYPGSADAHAFAAYMRAHQIESSLFFAAYGERKVDEVSHSLAERRKLIEFALAEQGQSPGDLQASFRRTFT